MPRRFVSMLSRPCVLCALIAVLGVLGQSGLQAQEPTPSADAKFSAPPDLNDGWAVAAPSQVGFDESRLDVMTEAVRAGEYGNVHALLIERNGTLAYEEYFEGEDWSWGSRLGRVRFGRASLHDLRSVSKSVVSTLVGIAIHRGEIEAVDVPLHQLLPTYGHLLTDEKRRIQLWHVLTMSAGLEWDEWSVPYTDPANDERRLYESGDPAAYVLQRDLVEEPGSRFAYNGGLTEVLAAVLEAATGRSMEEYAREHLFSPLGIYDVIWRADSRGRPSAAAGLRLRPRDVAKLGSLFLGGGVWGERRILSQEWVTQASDHQLPIDQDYVPDYATDVGYGYQWWHVTYTIPQGRIQSPSAVGNGNQRIILLPEIGISVTLLAGLYDAPDPQAGWLPDRLVIEHVVPALSVEELDS